MNSFRRLMIGWSSNLILVFFRGSILGLLLAFAISVHKKQSLSEWLFIPFCIGIGCSIGAIMESRNKKPNVPVSGGTSSAQVGCSADFCETRIAVESATKHRGQWENTPRRPYPQNEKVEDPK